MNRLMMEVFPTDWSPRKTSLNLWPRMEVLLTFELSKLERVLFMNLVIVYFISNFHKARLL